MREHAQGAQLSGRDSELCVAVSWHLLSAYHMTALSYIHQREPWRQGALTSWPSTSRPRDRLASPVSLSLFGA